MGRARSAKGVNCAAGAGAPLYDQLERALIALEYALADARAYESARAFAKLHRIARKQRPGAEIAEAWLSLQTAALQSAARHAAHWD